MQQLNLPICAFKIKTDGERKQIFDEIRKKYVALTPEEWVRQHFVKYLINEKLFPVGLIAIETTIIYNRMKKRSDVVVYDRLGKPLLIVECKAPEVRINQVVFDQVACYNMALKVKYIVLTNGMIHYCCRMNTGGGRYEFLDEVPLYKNI